MPRSSRQQQTRLAFTPLPSSSPAAKGYNKQIQDRAAAVTLSSSARSQRYTSDRSLTRQVDGANDALPTPASPYELGINDAGVKSGSDSEPVRHSQRRQSNHARPQPRQQRLDFSNARDPSSFSPPFRLSSSSSRPQSSRKAGMFGTQQTSKSPVDISSDSGSEEELPSARKLVARRRSSQTRENRAVTRSRTVSEVLDEDHGTIVVKRRSSPTLIQSGDEDEDEDEMPTTAGTQRRKRAPRRSTPDSFIASSPPQMNEESDDDLEIIEPPTKRRRRNHRESDNEGGEDEVEPRTPQRRRLKSSRKLSQREQDELDEDLDFLGPSSDVEKSARKSRESHAASKNAKQKALEALKRRRSNQTQDARHPGQTNVNSDDAESIGELQGDEDEDTHEHVQPTRSSQMFQEDEDDKGFIESDVEENTLGIPDGLPLEFTRYASMKPKELFKYAVEWFVQKKMNPGFQINDPIYELTFRKLDDEVAGLAGSKFRSAAWNDEFIYTLNARPEIAHEEIDRMEAEHFMRDSCDACNRSGHPATYQIQFHGKPYHRQTLEEVAGNDDDDDDDSSSQSQDSNESTYDADGRPIPPETKTWYVGKFCKSNAQTAHALQHWRYHLNAWVMTWLDKNGYNNPDEVIKRDSMSTKRRRKYADRIADELEGQGVVKALYRDYKNNIDDARNSKQGRYRGSWE